MARKDRNEPNIEPRLRRLAVAGLLLSLSCGGSSFSCGSCGSVDGYRFPIDDEARPDAVVVEEAIRVRLTQGFLDFLRPRLPAVIQSQLSNQAGVRVDDSGLVYIPVPSVGFDFGPFSASVDNGEAVLYLEDIASRVDLRFVEPNLVRFELANLRLGLNANVNGSFGGDFTCPIFGALNGSPVDHAAEFSVSSLIDPRVGPSPDQAIDIDIELGPISIDRFDVDIAGSTQYCRLPRCRDCIRWPWGGCIDPPCLECEAACSVVLGGVTDLTSFLLGVLRPILSDIMRPIVEGLIGETLQQLNGQPARFEAQLSAAELAGLDLLRGEPIGLMVGAQPGPFPVLDRDGLGMDLALEAGAESPLADCVTERPPFEPSLGPPPELDGLDRSGEAYHMAMTVAATYLNQLLDSVHRSGSLCLHLGTEDIRDLTGGAFTINASLLTLLAPDLGELASDGAPVLLKLKPSTPAVIELGTGEEIDRDGNDEPIFDWLLNLGVEDLGLAFYVLMHDRYVRVFEVQTDVFVGMNLVVQPSHELEVALGELRIDSFDEVFNELLPNADFGAILPALLDLALGALLNQSLRFDLNVTPVVSDVLGGVPIGLRVNDIYRDGVMNDYLSLALSFTDANQSVLAVETQASLSPQADLLRQRPGLDPSPTGLLSLQVGQGLPLEILDEREYQVRVDRGLWSAPKRARPDGSLDVPQPRLRLPGRHVVEVRARLREDYRTLDRTPVMLDVVVDPARPTLSAVWVEAGLKVSVQDRYTQSASELRLWVERNGDVPEQLRLHPLTNNSATVTLPYEETNGYTLSFVAVDAAGNRSLPLRVDGPSIQVMPEAEAPLESTEGCSHRALSKTKTSWCIALGLLVLMGIRRGRKHGISGA